MSNNETFKIRFEERTIEILKSSAKFQYGYAVIQKTIKDTVKDDWSGR